MLSLWVANGLFRGNWAAAGRYTRPEGEQAIDLSAKREVRIDTPARRAPHFGPQAWICDQPSDCVSHRKSVVRWREEAGHSIFDQLGGAADARGDRGHRARARFHEAQRHSL